MQGATTAFGSSVVLEARVARWAVRIHAARVLETIARVAFVPLPGAPLGVRGVIDHRGAAAVVIDLRERFGADAPTRRWDPMVVVEGTPRLALIVDELRGVGPLPDDVVIEPALPTSRIAGVTLGADGAALLIDPGALLDEAEIAQLRAALEGRS
ncbi:chemotaxis protein CheW [Sandaracinus amylolyticus]|uniref:chemotaxis protein CheW n=1 Tax=Sandaracinus amylolyticus TaxID=927083 RepID=UPI001F20F6D9|nr:chemotaxis protein CheW [Sandaracinus amylolyticus]UJR81326.1 CheW-like domain-containing protein [Sandaracinus amylolyticus]